MKCQLSDIVYTHTTQVEANEMPNMICLNSPDVCLEQHGLSHVRDSAEDHQAAVPHRDHGVLAEHDRLAPEQ